MKIFSVGHDPFSLRHLKFAIQKQPFISFNDTHLCNVLSVVNGTHKIICKIHDYFVSKMIAVNIIDINIFSSILYLVRAPLKYPYFQYDNKSKLV